MLSRYIYILLLPQYRHGKDREGKVSNVPEQMQKPPNNNLLQLRQRTVEVLRTGAERAKPIARYPLENIPSDVRKLRAAVRVPQVMQEFVLEMQARGFHLVALPDELRNSKNEYLFNRGDGKKSNFFVFAELTENNAIRVMYTNPTGPDAVDPRTGKKGIDLGAEQILVNEVFKFGFRNLWINGLCDEISRAASAKPEDVYFANMHGHWGRHIDGTSLMDMHLDDGRSAIKDIVRNFILWNMDIDATGFHNHFDLEFFRHVEKLEADVGIVKVPAFELTLPLWLYGGKQIDGFIGEMRQKLPDFIMQKAPELVKGGRDPNDFIWVPRHLEKRKDGSYPPQLAERIISTNKWLIDRYNAETGNTISVPTPNLVGPHSMVYCDSVEVAQDISKKILSKRAAEYPPLGPKFEMADILSTLRNQYKGKVAVELAHPAGNPKLMAGIIIMMANGDMTLPQATEMVRNADAVAIWNPTNKDKGEIEFKYGKPYFEGLVKKWNSQLNGKLGTKLTQNALNVAFALEMKEKYGKPAVFDTDEHDYLEVACGKATIDRTGWGWTRFKGLKEKGMAGFVAHMKSSPREIDSALFFTMNRKQGIPTIVEARMHRTFWEDVRYLVREYYVYGLKGGPILLRDAINRVKERKPDTIPELWDAFVGINKIEH